jgi:hypothetical protein
MNFSWDDDDDDDEGKKSETARLLGGVWSLKE